MTSDNGIQSIIDSFEEAVWTVDRSLHITFANAYFKKDFKEAFGIDLHQGADLFSLVSKKMKELWLPKYEAALRGKRVSFEFKENGLRGKKYFRVNLNPIKRDGKISGVAVISVDITTEKRAQLQVEREQRRAQLYLDIAGVMFVAIDKNGTVTMVNKKLCEITGYKKEEIIGENWFLLMIPERFQEEIIFVSKKLLHGEIEPVEYYENQIRTKDGEECTVAWHNTLLKDKRGKITGHLSSGMDITGQRILEEQLKKREELFRTVADYTADWEYWKNPDGTYTYISPSVETITGYTPEDFNTIPELYETIIHPDDRDLFKLHSETVSRERDAVYFRIITKSNTVKWISHVCRAIYDAEGVYRGRRGSNRDVTKRMLAESEVRKLLIEKEYLLKEVHHRIKNNMTTLLSIITLQSDAVENEEAKNALESIEKRVWSMLSLYETLFQAEDFQNVSVKHYLSSLVDSILATFPEAEKITVQKKL